MKAWERVGKGAAFLALVLVLVPFVSPVHAATDASFSLVVPNNGTLVQGCFYSADIIMRTGSNEVNAADILISYDPSRIEVIDAVPHALGTQIKTGNAFETYFGNSVDEQNGKIRLTGASFDSYVTGEKVFGTILFRSKAQVENGAFSIGFYGPGRSDDSNIAITQSGQDALGSVSNAALTFLPGACVSDKDAPAVTFITPASYSSNIPVDSPVIIELSDDLSGVDLNTLEIFINGNRYTPSHQDANIEQISGRYRVRVDQKDALPASVPSSIVVHVRDHTGNLRQSYVTFNFGVTPQVVTQAPPRPTDTVTDSVSPVITFTSPLARQTIADGTDIVFQLIDKGSGIRNDSLRIFVNEKSYSITDTRLELTGTGNEYTVRIRDAFAFPKNAPSFLAVFVTDQYGNAAAESILFNIPESMVLEELPKPALCVQEPEEKGQRGLWSNAPWGKHITDTEKKLLVYTPRIVKALVSELGLLGLIALLLALPLLARLFARFAAPFLSGGVFTLLSTYLSTKDKQYTTIRNTESGKPVRFASIECIDATHNRVYRMISTHTGRFILRLQSGTYTFVINKYGYIPLIREITLSNNGFVDDNFVMRAYSNQVVSHVVRKMFILALIVSIVNMLYTFTSVSVTLAGVVLLIVIVFTIVVMINRKTKQKNNSSV